MKQKGYQIRVLLLQNLIFHLNDFTFEWIALKFSDVREITSNTTPWKDSVYYQWGPERIEGLPSIWKLYTCSIFTKLSLWSFLRKISLTNHWILNLENKDIFGKKNPVNNKENVESKRRIIYFFLIFLLRKFCGKFPTW